MFTWQMIVGGIALIIVVVYIIVYIPIWQIKRFTLTGEKERFDAENSARDTISKILGGIVVLVGLFTTWKSVQLSEASAKIAKASADVSEKTLAITQEGQFADRFVKAIDLLSRQNTGGTPALESRMGGIYALERIANSSSNDYGPVMEALTGYVRMNSRAKNTTDSNPTPARVDIQAILTVIGRRKFSYEHGETQHLDLNHTNLGFAKLPGASLQGMILNGAMMLNTDLMGAHLEKASLRDTHVQGAVLTGAHLEGADLTGSNITQEQIKGLHVDASTALPLTIKR